MQEHFRGQRQPTPHVCADFLRSGFQKPCASEPPTAAKMLALCHIPGGGSCFPARKAESTDRYAFTHVTYAGPGGQ
jgi:hypothetical protein